MARVLNAFRCCQILPQKNRDVSNPYTLVDIFLTFLSIGSFLADISTDIIVIIQYYINGHILWMFLTTSLVCVPSFVVQIFSIRWYIIDGMVSKFLCVVHVLQLGVFLRYIQLLHLGLKIRENNTFINLRNFNQQQSDVCMLRLFESFMESAPQLILQLYIMVSTDEWNPWTGISAVASIFSLSWGIAAYSKAMRNVQPDKNNLSWWGLLFQSLWRIGMVSSRIISMVLFATVYGSWLILILGITSLLLYYHCFHPSGQIEVFKSKQTKTVAVDQVDGKMRTRTDSCTLKTGRKFKDANSDYVESRNTTASDSYSAIEQEKDMNISRISIKSLNNISCVSELHRSHSLNCSLKCNLTNNTSFLYCVPRNQKSIANHHRNINYHFRPAVLDGLSSIKIYCSCLVLTQDLIYHKTTILSPIPKPSKSMPNLENNLIFDNAKDICISRKNNLKCSSSIFI